MNDAVYNRLAVAIALGALSVPFPAASRPHVSSPGLRPPPPVAPPKVIEPVPKEEHSAPEKSEQGEAPDKSPSIDEGGVLNLMCFGGGGANRADTATAYAWNSWGYSSTATVFRNRNQAFEDQVSLHVQQTEGRIRMPRTMLPAIRGGKDGWFKLHEIKIKPNEITASVGVNAFNNPKLRLDRFSGAISISGKAGDYAGRCKKFDPDKERRAF